jgi:hypothetical protein
MRRVSWTAEMDDLLVSLTDQNVGSRIIAAELGVDRGTVKRRRKLLGIGGGKAGRPRLYDDAKVLRLAAIIDASAMAERLGVSRCGAYGAIRRARLRQKAHVETPEDRIAA